jgi:predicted transcriptional regulator of viral defense system
MAPAQADVIAAYLGNVIADVTCGRRTRHRGPICQDLVMHPGLPTLARLAARQGGVVTREQARRAGCTESEIRRFLHRGDWTAVRRGLYAASDAVVEPRLRLIAEAAACWLALGRRPVISHGTAAMLHGLVPSAGPTVELTADPNQLHWRGNAGFRLHTACLPPHHTTESGGLPVTSVARTAVDLCRRLPYEEGVAMLDDALHRELVARDELDRVLRDCAVWPRIRHAALAVAASERLAESPLETVCRLTFARHGLPAPECQALVVDPADGWRARVDFHWPAHRTVVEADGRLKYATPADLWNEKLRQERIEELGYAVLRVTWPQVTSDPAGTVARVLRAFVRGARLGGGSGSPTG